MASAFQLDEKYREQHQHFYLVVYTQTDADVGRYVCGGGLDIGLNEAGIAEARKFARRFKKNPLKIKRMVASPELRSIQMADVLHDEMKGRIGLWREFSDQFFGEWEGKPWDENMDLKTPPKGETDEGFSLRIRTGLERLFQEKDLILVVTHARVAKKILQWMGLAKVEIEAGKMYSVDWPVGDGIPHVREV